MTNAPSPLSSVSNDHSRGTSPDEESSPPPTSQVPTSVHADIDDVANDLAKKVLMGYFPDVDFSRMQCAGMHPTVASVVVEAATNRLKLPEGCFNILSNIPNNPRRVYRANKKPDTADHVVNSQGYCFVHSMLAKIDQTPGTQHTRLCDYFNKRKPGRPAAELKMSDLNSMAAKLEVSQLTSPDFPMEAISQSRDVISFARQIEHWIDDVKNKGSSVHPKIKGSYVREYPDVDLYTLALTTATFVDQTVKEVKQKQSYNAADDNTQGSLILTPSKVRQNHMKRKREEAGVQSSSQGPQKPTSFLDFPDPAGHFQTLATKSSKAFDEVTLDLPTILDEFGNPIYPPQYADRLTHGTVVVADIHYKVFDFEPSATEPLGVRTFQACLQRLRILPTTVTAFNQSYPKYKDAFDVKDGIVDDEDGVPRYKKIRIE
ncbi:hypothetical protein VKT23_009989 [Stygiomarasmius scandens]|uniref:Uncharacterized protein n=1 Tax=Marasmiellus scandens TaxID=2682957 RepID=A0ABR1JI05_9AGAR